jgi:hypothetical protein
MCFSEIEAQVGYRGEGREKGGKGTATEWNEYAGQNPGKHVVFVEIQPNA